MRPLLPEPETYHTPPGADEIEVTVIGPGFGETALVHIGDNRWICIDSCKGRDDPAPAALRYLADIGVDPEAVMLILVSHWDDDHCAGLADLVTACAAARVVLAKAFIDKDFISYASAFSEPLVKGARAGAKEIHGTIKALVGSNRVNDAAAMADRCLYQAAALPMSHAEPVEIWTLSPCDFEMNNFLAWVGTQMPDAGETRRVAVRRKRNDLSVALHVSVGGDTILLGGDLEEDGHPQRGWSAVLTSTGRPQKRAGLFKVPHHGSITGDHDDVWSGMLTADPVALIAPFRKGNVSLPAAGDVSRVSGRTPHAISSSNLQSLAPPPLDRAVQKMVDLVAKKLVPIHPAMGFVRARKKAGSILPWTVTTHGAAAHLSRVR